MTFLGLLGHLIGFFAPALGVAALMCLALRLWPRVKLRVQPGRREFFLLSLAGAAVLLVGLIAFGRDAKMLTYTALVMAQGSLGWWMQRR